MRHFKCSSCGHEFSVPFGNGQMGSQMKCPQCGGVVHRSHCVNGGGSFGFGRGSRGNYGRGKFAGRGRGFCRRSV
ncbi:putative RNA-binding Zn-ribbon protein involved in translation (DUF1610 family) [Desulfohalotomaculum tongense]|uniref:hypothetical protein n=1 Tax=Desulforadius tongensis TaxID=1216062 RepID=UPI00195A4A3F|nr:hypothetical protein [Desulforadius tongensis]MBM7853955.1 putative RNA-binding Zn-ribbon protein involved in translation (DUF1610 family) [Desulforadius tongensis]